MPSERIQRRIVALLDEAEDAISSSDWLAVAGKARAVLAIDETNSDALDFLRMALANVEPPEQIHIGTEESPPAEPFATPSLPTSFVGGRYEVVRFLGEGGKKRVFLAHDNRLDRDVAFALIKTDGLDDIGRQRIVREAQAMGRLGAHANIVTIFEMGDDAGSPFVVNELLSGGDVEGELEKAGGPLPLRRALEIAEGVCRGLAFAHARGIVHRDLKPGNVWLTADGVAKIGDFGLAVSLGRSRLTQHGMMVGTVLYMPPEQALGGEVTPQADLYSLGAMLYELVTGKPPFEADDPTAVISQHINVTPVSPSWLAERCPPELESLILRLLSKLPQDRPQSAQEVLEALQAIDPDAGAARPAEVRTNPLDRLARGAFVGRERELERLRTAMDDALAGRGSLAMLVGEPGIGKTRVAQELETYARTRGAQVLWGRSHESSAAPAYWPWVQVGRQWGAANEAASIRDELAPSRGELVRLFPELRALGGFVEPDSNGEPESSQFRLFEAFAMFVRAMQRQSPTVIALDDLHWADKPTLLLLQHLAREVAHLRVLIVCTYRDTDLSRTHPLSEALATLNREAGFQRIVLRGLTRDEVRSYIRVVAKIEPKQDVLERIFEETEGNPFFLSEVINLLTQEGTLARNSLSDIAVPDGVKEALGRRLDRLSEDANSLLQVAAIVGREFAYDTLDLLADKKEDELLRLIEEGIEARVIEELSQPGRYRFMHALMQETLLAELSTTRRVRLHGQVGEALERRWGARADQRAPRLAEHFLEASMLTARHARQAIHYGQIAASQAEAQFAWSEGARWYERILTLTTLPETELDEAAVLKSMGRCLLYAHDLRASYGALMRANTLFRESGRSVEAGETVLLLLNIPMLRDRQTSLVAAALATELQPRQRALLLARSTRFSGTRAERLRELSPLLVGNDWPEVEAEAELGRAWYLLEDTQSFDEARSVLTGAAVSLAEVGNLTAAAAAKGFMAGAAVRMGFLDAAAKDIEEQLAFADEHRLLTFELQGYGALASIHLARGQFADYERCQLRARGEGWSKLLVGWRARTEGEPERALAAVPAPDASIIPGFWAQFWAERACGLWQLGEIQQATAEFGNFLDEVRRTKPGFALATAVAVAVDGLSSLIDASIAAELLGSHILSGTLSGVPSLSLNRVRADLHAIAGDINSAGKEYAKALEICTREQLPFELGRCHQGLAALAELTNHKVEAREHLDAAGEFFRAYGARLQLEQVLAKKEFLKA